MKTLNQILKKLFAAVSLPLISISCVPVFSDLQSARTLGKGQVEATPYYTITGLNNEDKGASHFGGNIGVGLSDKIDIRAKYESNWLNEEENTAVTILGIGPKFSLIPDRLAFFLPAGAMLQEGKLDFWQIHPTVFFTQPIVKDRLEFTVAPKYLLNICEDCSGNFATNFGLSASKDFKKYAWRAEYGRIISNGSVGQFSLGFSFFLIPKNQIP